ncbi:MAG: Sapep family Mn(2+)-dependent dipeptidase [Clostridia bacterium]|nr:Sapep family Mn(2+)-dependent dipeptidase [Clostridia bacterium]
MHLTERYFDETVEFIVEMLQYASTQGEPEEGAPFGKETAACLSAFLAKAESFGFETKNYDGYIGEVIFGEGEPFAILAHLDVVPAGDGWKYPPFGGVINDDLSDSGVAGKKIWGRGALDDKSPAVCCLYALKALKDEGITPKRQIKLILGCNEESGWQCIEHYKKVATLPKEGFTPDADFPVIYAEKGILHFTLSFPMENAPFKTLTAGERVNMVCSKATALLTKDAGGKLSLYEKFTECFYDNTTGYMVTYGKSAHASTPHKGENALAKMFAFFATIHEGCKKVYDVLFADQFALQSMEDETGALTMSPNLATFENGVLKITVDVRFPATHSKDEVLAPFAENGIAATVNNYQAPLYNDPNGKLIRTLLKVYNEAMGADATPIAIGGGTYARALERGCAFGPEVPGEESTIHQANEFVTFERIALMNKIYYEAIRRVACESQDKYRVMVIKTTRK